MRPHHDVVSPTLSARESELIVARESLQRAREGSAHVTLVVGEAGVGKSRLLRAMVDSAVAGGFLILKGASFESDRSIPYAPLLDLLRAFAGSGSSARFAHLFSAAAPELVALFPELRAALPGITPNPAVDPEADKRRLF